MGLTIGILPFKLFHYYRRDNRFKFKCQPPAHFTGFYPSKTSKCSISSGARLSFILYLHYFFSIMVINHAKMDIFLMKVKNEPGIQDS